MANKPLNRSFHAAKATKQDEFYTQLSDIEKELRHYTKHFKNKTVLCNCDDPKVSNFFHYFSHNFEKLGLKKLITTLGGPHSLDRNRAFLSYSRAGLPDRQLRLILLPSSFRDYGKTPGETEVGSAGEQPAKG